MPSSAWIDDTKRWPPMDYKNIFNYLVLSEGVDGESMENYKSMDSYVHFESGKVGTVLVYEAAPGFLYLKAEVRPSQPVNNAKHTAWVLTMSDGVETAGCECLAGRGRSCSHAGAILWKVCYVFRCTCFLSVTTQSRLCGTQVFYSCTKVKLPFCKHEKGKGCGWEEEQKRRRNFSSLCH